MNQFTPDQLEALKIAGGCEHTPSPFDACDTCGRAALPGSNHKITAYDFVARTLDGKTFPKKDVLSVSNLPLDRVYELIVKTDDPRNPRITLQVDPTKGERLHMFTRRAFHLNGPPMAVAMPVFEISYEGTEHRLRLYLHPLRGPILTTADIYP